KDFIERYLDKRDYILVLMDTDSIYVGFSDKDWKSLVRPELAEEFAEMRKNFLPTEASEDPVKAKYDARTPGLFHEEFVGLRMVNLNPKTYWGFGLDPNKPA